MIKSILHVKSLKKGVVYLGAPLFLSRAPSKDFSYLQDKLEVRLTGWRSKCLSRARRKTLIKSVAQSLPIYIMSTFNIPNKVCDKLDFLTRRFWWRPRDLDGKFLARRAWDKLCQPRGPTILCTFSDVIVFSVSSSLLIILIFFELIFFYKEICPFFFEI